MADSLTLFTAAGPGATIAVDFDARKFVIDCVNGDWLNDERLIATGDKRRVTVTDAHRRKVHELLDEFLDVMRGG